MQRTVYRKSGFLRQTRPLPCLFCGLLLLAVLGLCSGCSSAEKKTEYLGYYIFYPDANETRVGFEQYTPKAKTRDDLVREFLKKLKRDPHNIELKKALPDDVKIDEFLFDDSNQLSLYLSSGYGKLKSVSEILRRAAIVKTLCQIKDVDGVQFYVAGQPLTDFNLNPVGFMTAESFVDNTGGETAYHQKATLNMYFSDSTGQKLLKTPVDITYDATIPLEQLAVEQLIKGPYSIDGADKDKLRATIPEKTKLNKITIKDSICYVDFTDAFLNKRVNVSEEATIYSVVNTLTELPNINKVQFSIDGQQVLLYNDTMDFGSIFERNLDIVLQE